MVNELNRLKEFFKKNSIDSEKVCIVGSLTLEVLDIRESNDIDVVILPEERNQLGIGSDEAKIVEHNIEVVKQEWGMIFGVSDKELISNSNYWFKIDGIKIVRPEILFSKKNAANREKDKKDILLLENYALEASNDWDWKLVQLPVEEHKNLKSKVKSLLRYHLNQLKYYFKKEVVEFEQSNAEDKEHEIFKIILWPPVEKFFNQITSEIKKDPNIEVIEIEDLFLGKRFEEFVRDIYRIDDIERWKIEKKISGMVTNENKIRIIHSKFKKSNFRIKNKSNNKISIQSENYKKIYREKYKNSLNNYFKDIIIHITDNEYQNIKSKDIINEYK